MKLTASWIEQKTITVAGTPRKIIEGTFIGDNQQKIEATIWREDRDGKIFPNFDTLGNGSEFEATPWLNPKTGKYSLYAPKAEARGSFAPKGGGISKLMDRKAEDRKEESIKKASAQRDAVLLTTTFYADQNLDDSQIASKLEQWRKYLLGKLEEPFN